MSSNLGFSSLSDETLNRSSSPYDHSSWWDVKHYHNNKSRSFLGFKFLLLYQFSNFLWHVLGLLECKKILRSRFAPEMIQNKVIDIQKGIFKRMV